MKKKLAVSFLVSVVSLFIFACFDDSKNGKKADVTDVSQVASFLSAQSGGASAADPVTMSVGIALGDMTTNTNWLDLLTAIATAGKFVDLDLSACSLEKTEVPSFGKFSFFNPDFTISTGKNKIVSLVLPKSTSLFKDGGSSTNPTFKNFTAL